MMILIGVIYPILVDEQQSVLQLTLLEELQVELVFGSEKDIIELLLFDIADCFFQRFLRGDAV